jgi:hypothetical protein
LEAVGVVAVFVVVKESKTYVARESFVDSGVEDLFRMAVRKWLRSVVFPAPDSPLDRSVSIRTYA